MVTASARLTKVNLHQPDRHGGRRPTDWRPLKGLGSLRHWLCLFIEISTLQLEKKYAEHRNTFVHVGDMTEEEVGNGFMRRSSEAPFAPMQATNSLTSNRRSAEGREGDR